MIQHSANTKAFNLELLTELTCFIFTLWFKKCFEVTENIQKFKSDGDWSKLWPKICVPGNPNQNIWHKLMKYSKIEQGLKNVISNFAYFLTAILND